MFDEVWQAVVGKRYATVAGEVFGFRCHKIRGEVYPGISRSTEAVDVQGLVHLDVDSHCIAKLDRFEGNLYRRETIDVHCIDERLRPAVAYIVPESKRQLLSEEIWTPEEFKASGGLEHFLLRFGGFRRLAEE